VYAISAEGAAEILERRSAAWLLSAPRTRCLERAATPFHDRQGIGPERNGCQTRILRFCADAAHHRSEPASGDAIDHLPHD
jgi:hypothetical protein